jgi:hypothetical protein
VGSMRPDKLLARIAVGAVRNADFDDLIKLLQMLDFKEIGGRGSHRVFVHAGVDEILTLHELRGQASPIRCAKF